MVVSRLPRKLPPTRLLVGPSTADRAPLVVEPTNQAQAQSFHRLMKLASPLGGCLRGLKKWRVRSGGCVEGISIAGDLQGEASQTESTY
jgi:hypothetical protein